MDLIFIMYYVYVLYLSTREFYKGYAQDLQKRVKEHNNGYVDSTKNKRPMELAYYEAYQNKRDAMDRERYFKTGWGRLYLKKVLKNYTSKKLNPKT